MERLLQRDDRGLSEIISYVLLVVIALGIAGGVYSFLKAYVPKEQVKCSDDIGLSIDEVSCLGGQLNVTVNNRGLFNINGMYVKVKNESRVYSRVVNNGSIVFLAPLEPGDKLTRNYSYSEIGNKEVEIDPIVLMNNVSVICSKAIVSKKVVCV